VDLVYLQRATAWSEKGTTRVELPAVDLPVSRTGLLVRFSPRFQVEPKPGAFRLESDPGPFSAVLRNEVLVTASSSLIATTPPPPPAAPMGAAAERAADASSAADFKALIDRYRRDMGKTSAGTIPVEVSVPDFGPRSSSRPNSRRKRTRQR
jgi:hypothetical protein